MRVTWKKHLKSWLEVGSPEQVGRNGWEVESRCFVDRREKWILVRDVVLTIVFVVVGILLVVFGIWLTL